MAEAVGAAVAVVSAFFKTTVTVMGLTVSYGTIAQVALVGGSYAYQRQQTKKALRRLAGAPSLDPHRSLTIKEAAGVRTLIYGQMKVGGVLAFAEVSGTDKEYLHVIVVHAGHECESIDAVYLNDELVPLDGSGNATGTYAGYLRVKKHLGADSQTVDTDLQSDVGSGVWSNDHRLRGICYTYWRFKANQDLFPNSLPNMSAVIKGAKVYDPRTTTTYWSANSALCLRHYLTLSRDRGGLGATADEIDDAAVIVAANLCDEVVVTA